MDSVDCDDTDPEVHESDITGIRLGGEIGDQFIGPTCNGDDTYRTCFYVSGSNLPAENPFYQIKINGVEYPVAFTATDGDFRVVCATGLPLLSCPIANLFFCSPDKFMAVEFS